MACCLRRVDVLVLSVFRLGGTFLLRAAASEVDFFLPPFFTRCEGFRSSGSVSFFEKHTTDDEKTGSQAAQKCHLVASERDRDRDRER